MGKVFGRTAGNGKGWGKIFGSVDALVFGRVIGLSPIILMNLLKQTVLEYVRPQFLG